MNFLYFAYFICVMFYSLVTTLWFILCYTHSLYSISFAIRPLSINVLSYKYSDQSLKIEAVNKTLAIWDSTSFCLFVNFLSIYYRAQLFSFSLQTELISFQVHEFTSSPVISKSPNSKFDRNLQSLCKPCITSVPVTLGVIERKGMIKISLLGNRPGRSRLRRLQNQTKTTTNGQLTLFCLTDPQIKKKINSATAILDRTYSRVTDSNKVHSTWLKGKEE